MGYYKRRMKLSAGKSVGVDDGKGRNSGDDLGDSRPSLGADSPGIWTRPRVRGANAPTPGGCWTASSSGCAVAASGTVCPGNWETTALSTGPSNAGWSLECWRASGLFLRRKSGRSGLGMARRTAPWGQGPFWGGAIGRNPTDRGKASWSTRAGGPLSVAVAEERPPAIGGEG